MLCCAFQRTDQSFRFDILTESSNLQFLGRIELRRIHDLPRKRERHPPKRGSSEAKIHPENQLLTDSRGGEEGFIGDALRCIPGGLVASVERQVEDRGQASPIVRLECFKVIPRPAFVQAVGPGAFQMRILVYHPKLLRLHGPGDAIQPHGHHNHEQDCQAHRLPRPRHLRTTALKSREVAADHSGPRIQNRARRTVPRLAP
jgi:hypothetical protein